jgi:hypothetical protein
MGRAKLAEPKPKRCQFQKDFDETSTSSVESLICLRQWRKRIRPTNFPPLLKYSITPRHADTPTHSFRAPIAETFFHDIGACVAF